jgi:hypothetical protein
LRRDLTQSVRGNMGISNARLITYVIMGSFYLLLIYFFIFVGIAAFSTGGKFSAVINSGEFCAS